MKTKLYCSGLSYQTRPNAVLETTQYQLPRLALARLNQPFLPDYALLLLTEGILLDQRTFEELVRGLIPVNGAPILALKSLYDAGLVEVVDFEKTYATVREQALTDLDQCLMTFKDWENAVAQSVDNWRIYHNALQENLRPKVVRLRQMVAQSRVYYADLGSNYLHDLAGRIQMLKFFAEDALPAQSADTEVLPDTELFTNHLREHLLSAIYSLALSRNLKAGFHEWTDAAPYYRKLMGSENAPALFELPIPEFSLWNPDKLVKAMTSKAAVDLRAIAKETLLKGKPWNEKAAAKCLMSIARIDQGMPSVRRVSGYRKAEGKNWNWWLISEALGSKPLPPAA